MADKSALISQEDLRPVLKFVEKNWYLMLLFPLFAYAGAYWFTETQPDVYASKAELLLKQQESFDYQTKLYQNLGYQSLVQDVINQKRVLKSHNIIEKTLDKLDFDISYFKTGGISTDELEVLGFFRLEVDLVEFRDNYKRFYERPFTIEVLDDDNYKLTYESGDEEKAFHYAFDQKVNDPFPFTLQKQPEFEEKDLKQIQDKTYVFVIHSRENLVKKYKRSLKLKNEPYTSIISLAVEDYVKKRPTRFLDTLASVYLNYTLENQKSVNENTKRYIERQIKELEGILDSLENEIRKFKENKEILDLSKEQVELFNSVTALERDRRTLDIRIKSLSEIKSYSYSEKGNTSLPPLLLSGEDGILQQQVNRLFDLKIQRVQLLGSSTEENTEVIRLDELIAIVIKNIQDYVDNTILSLQANAILLKQEIRGLERELKDIPVSQQEIIGIERKYAVNDGLYKFLLEKKASTVIAKAAIIPQVTIIESARSAGVVGPNRTRIKTIALGAGFLFSLLIGLIRFMFFDKIENLREFKDATTLPVVGSVPSYSNIKEKPLAIEDDLRSNISESLRALRANLQYLLVNDGKPKRILTSSLHPGEGKTFVSTNLSSFLAHTNKKCVVLDFDMHKPKVHKVFKLTNKVGLSSFLIGKQPIENIIQDCSIDHLKVITAGPIPPNASDLILSDRVEELLVELEKQFDYIFIDTPPLMLISDSLVLMKLVDIGLFVFNTEKASKPGLQYLQDLLEQNNIKKVSLILNNVRHKRWLYYYGKYAYKYSYKYGAYSYSYAYGNEKPKKKRRFKKKKD